MTSEIVGALSAAARPCITCSFQAEGMVVLHQLLRHLPDIPVLFLDTLHHFPETYAYRDRMAAEWRLNLRTLRAPEPAVGLWRTSTDACCAQHKVGPLFGALSEYDLWFTGLRREQSRSRATLDALEQFPLPTGQVIAKANPLVHWTTAQVAAYMDEQAIPWLPLYARGYTSIGCEPCTTLPLDPADPRSGRWAGQKLECGIHRPHGAAEPGIAVKSRGRGRQE